MEYTTLSKLLFVLALLDGKKHPVFTRKLGEVIEPTLRRKPRNQPPINFDIVEAATDLDQLFGNLLV